MAACGAPPATETPVAAPSPPRPALLADVGARPRLAVISVASARRAALRNAELVTNIVNGLPLSTRFLILTNDPSAFTVARNEHPDRVRFVTVPFVHPITIWTQDPFLVLTGGDGTTLLTSREFERADDRLMAAAVAEQAGYELVSSQLYFEGGNIVSDREHVLIGANTIRHNAVELATSEAEVVLRFERELGRRVLVVGPVPQPVSHIDMMVTPLGGGRIALADPAAGARIAERELETAASAVEAFERSTRENFFGHPSIEQLTFPDRVTEPPRLLGTTREMIDRSRELAPVLDRVAESLAEHGYRVERVPFLDGGPEIGKAEEAQREDEAARASPAGYPMLTYNNVLLADDHDGPVVHLPRYGFAALDRAAEQAWRVLGFRARPIAGLSTSAMYGGSLRCSVKVLERE